MAQAAGTTPTGFPARWAAAMLPLIAAAILLLFPAMGRADSHPDAAKVVAIGGSVTEIIYALDQQDRLVARDTSSSYPEAALDLPDIGYMRTLSAEGVLSVGPDLILSEDGAGPPETVALLQSAGVPFEQIGGAFDSDEIAAKIRAVAEVLGVSDRAEASVAAMRADFDKLDALKEDGPRKKVMFVLAVQGGRVIASGRETEADAIISLAGAENAVEGFEGYKPLNDEAISAAAPDIILMMQRGDTSADLEASNEDLLAMPAMATTPAAKDKAIIRMNGLYLLGFGPRTGQAALDLHKAIYGGSDGGA